MVFLLDRMLVMSSAAWQRYVRLVILGESKCFRKNSTVSACLVDDVEGM